MERGSEIVTLTKRQKELLDYLEGYIRRFGFAPTLDETGRHFGLTSLATVHKHLTNLEDKGFIRRRSGMSRRPAGAVEAAHHADEKNPRQPLGCAGFSCAGESAYTRSHTVVMPWPPPMHMVATP